MRKMIPSGHGGRVHFSMPDHEWNWFCCACNLTERDPFQVLHEWASFGSDSATMREMARNVIGNALHAANRDLSIAIHSQSQRRP